MHKAGLSTIHSAEVLAAPETGVVGLVNVPTEPPVAVVIVIVLVKVLPEKVTNAEATSPADTLNGAYTGLLG